MTEMTDDLWIELGSLHAFVVESGAGRPRERLDELGQDSHGSQATNTNHNYHTSIAASHPDVHVSMPNMQNPTSHTLLLPHVVALSRVSLLAVSYSRLCLS